LISTAFLAEKFSDRAEFDIVTLIVNICSFFGVKGRGMGVSLKKCRLLILFF